MEVEPHANPATGAFSGAPYRATNRVRGVPIWEWCRMRTLPLGPSAELPMGPTNRVRGVPEWRWNRMRTLPLGPSVEPPTGSTKRVRL
eukprot:501437-Pyramimonas_sp.AAC.1